MRFWSIVCFFAAASLIYNSLFDEPHSTAVRVLGIFGAIVTLVLGVKLWQRASGRPREELRSRTNS